MAADHGMAALIYAPDDAQIASLTRPLLAAPLTPDAAVRVALINSRRLQASFESFGVSESRYVQAITLTNPVLDIDFKVANGQSPKWDVSLLQNLIEILNLPTQTKIAKSELEAAKLRTAEAVLDLAMDVRLATIDAQAADGRAALQQQIADAAADAGDFADRLNKAGNLSPLQQDQHRMNAVQTKLDAADAKLDADLARERLTRVMGLDDPSRITLAPMATDEAAAVDTNDLSKRIESNNLKLGAMKQDLLAAGERAGIARDTAWIDQLQVGAAAERDEHWFVGPALNVPIPVFSQGQAQKLMANATARMDLQSYFAERVELQSMLRQNVEALQTAKLRIDAFNQSILPLRQQLFDLTQQHYNGMFADAFGLLQAKQEQLQAEMSAADAWRTYWHASIRLHHLLAGGSIDHASDETLVH